MVDFVLGEELFLFAESEVVATKGRALVAGDEGAGVQAGFPVQPHLIEREAHEGLNAGEGKLFPRSGYNLSLNSKHL